MVYRLLLWFPDCGSRCKHTCQSIPAAGILAQPAGSVHGGDAKQRFAHRDYGPKPQKTGSEQMRKWGWGGVGRRAFQSRRVFQRCRFNRRVAAFNQAREAPKEAFSEELGECGGQGGWGGDGAPHTLIMEARKGVVLLSHLFLLP